MEDDATKTKSEADALGLIFVPLLTSETSPTSGRRAAELATGFIITVALFFCQE